MNINFPARRVPATPIPITGFQQTMARAPEHGHPALKSAVSGLASAYERGHAGANSILADATLNAKARTVRAAKFIRTTLQPALASLEQARTAVEAGRVQLDAAYRRPLDMSARPFADNMICAEIRAHFASMGTIGDRAAAVMAAIEAGDVQTLTALAAAPLYLSGLTPELHGAAVAAVIEADPAAREARDHLAALARQAEFAQLVESTVLQSSADLVDMVEADSLMLMASDAAA